MGHDESTSSWAGGEEARGRGDESSSLPPIPSELLFGGDEAGGEKAGDFIGTYQLLQQIGRGGFGVVWLAERREPFVQRVAMKIIKPGMDSREVIARFEQERQALAVMNHPNVAKVIDGGITSPEMGSRPYFVMEHVKGEAITVFCDRNRLTIRQRLELFIPVCEAVQHAHMKGIIHRDIKPSNVLVTVVDGGEAKREGAKGESGQRDGSVSGAAVKVIDFGVAKAITHALTDKTIFTEQGRMIGTPEYMSPEQAEMGGTDIDTRTDVYSLGVVLYELLVGALPFDGSALRAAAHREMLRIIREVEPPTPSKRLTAIGEEAGAEIAKKRQAERESLARELRRELEWVPLKAMRKDRRERYRTPADLADDVRRFLAGEPLEAGPEGTGYRVKKFIRRNRGGVLTGCGFAAVLVLSTALSTVGFVSAARQRARADQEAAVADRRAAELETAAAVDRGMIESLSVTTRDALERRFQHGLAAWVTTMNRRQEIEEELGRVLGATGGPDGVAIAMFKILSDAEDQFARSRGQSSAGSATEFLNWLESEPSPNLMAKGVISTIQGLGLHVHDMRLTSAGTEALFNSCVVGLYPKRGKLWRELFAMKPLDMCRQRAASATVLPEENGWARLLLSIDIADALISRGRLREAEEAILPLAEELHIGPVVRDLKGERRPTRFDPSMTPREYLGAWVVKYSHGHEWSSELLRGDEPHTPGGSQPSPPARFAEDPWIVVQGLSVSYSQDSISPWPLLVFLSDLRVPNPRRLAALFAGQLTAEPETIPFKDLESFTGHVSERWLRDVAGAIVAQFTRRGFVGLRVELDPREFASKDRDDDGNWLVDLRKKGEQRITLIVGVPSERSRLFNEVDMLRGAWGPHLTDEDLLAK